MIRKLIQAKARISRQAPAHTVTTEKIVLGNTHQFNFLYQDPEQVLVYRI